MGETNGRKRTTRLLLMAALAVLLLTACSRVNRENYEKLSFGMDYAEAVTILGEPDHCKDVFNTRACTWGDEKKNIAIKIVAGKVVFLQATGI